MTRCARCKRASFDAHWTTIGGVREGCKVTGGTILCPECARQEIERLQVANEDLHAIVDGIYDATLQAHSYFSGAMGNPDDCGRMQDVFTVLNKALALHDRAASAARLTWRLSGLDREGGHKRAEEHSRRDRDD